MENQYSFWADLLNKFHTSSEWIQVLWLLALPLLLFGLSWCVKGVLVAFARRKSDAKGELVYSIYRNSENELLVYSHADTLEQVDTGRIIWLSGTQTPDDMQENTAKLQD